MNDDLLISKTISTVRSLFYKHYVIQYSLLAA
jgi:hypothetical protein